MACCRNGGEHTSPPEFFHDAISMRLDESPLWPSDHALPQLLYNRPLASRKPPPITSSLSWALEYIWHRTFLTMFLSSDHSQYLPHLRVLGGVIAGPVIE